MAARRLCASSLFDAYVRRIVPSWSTVTRFFASGRSSDVIQNGTACFAITSSVMPGTSRGAPARRTLASMPPTSEMWPIG